MAVVNQAPPTFESITGRRTATEPYWHRVAIQIPLEIMPHIFNDPRGAKIYLQEVLYTVTEGSKYKELGFVI